MKQITLRKFGYNNILIRDLTYGNFNSNKQLLKYPKTQILINQQQRQIMILTRILKGALKIRYLLLGGAVGGGVTLQNKYEEWKKALPDISWMDSIMPTQKQWSDFRTTLISLKDSINESIKLDQQMEEFSDGKFKKYKAWFNNRLNDAIKAAEYSDSDNNDNENLSIREIEVIKAFANQIYSDAKNDVFSNTTTYAASKNEKTNGHINNSEQFQKRLDAMQGEVMQIQIKYQRELERLERENKELRKQLLLRGKLRNSKQKLNNSLIDMYSDLIDELNEYDNTYLTTDHLPRIVVVGDQSSGKTSVLEMIAQARIFPRGGGEMMTRSPVKVTLSEGPYHIAQFKDSMREFDLTKESQLAELRNEIELRMKNSVRDGKTISHDVIAMTVKGPGLPRMVLIDLPGIISIATTDMASNTREDICQMSQQYMSNPNSIILCIQDGSVDAERSNVTELVSQMDPTGKRTIFVLTKVDMAEKNMTNPDRLRKILSGKLFPMKALGYFAVVTGRGQQNDSIQTIKDYEEEFFSNSKLFKGELGMSNQVTTGNLSLAVSECFWKMVRETVEQQADAFKATRFNLETEWKNLFPGLRELDRHELFEKARIDILDEVTKLSQISPRQWEDVLQESLWKKLSPYIFESIYIPAIQTANTSSFNTLVDIKLKHWAEQQLPAQSVDIGSDCLQEGFKMFINEIKLKPNHDDVFDKLIDAVIEDAVSKFTWENRAEEMLRVIQSNALEDRTVRDKKSWDDALTFMQGYFSELLKENDQKIRDLVGPNVTERWLYWRNRSSEQKKRNIVKSELEKKLYLNMKSRDLPDLTNDEITAVKANVASYGIDVNNEYIQEVWHPLYMKFVLQQSLLKTYDCRRGYYFHKTGQYDTMECNAVVLFWRIQQMIQVSANALRQQIINREARRFSREIKQILEDYGLDNSIKEKLLTNKRVILAEELKRVKEIQEKLEEFIKSLKAEK